MWGSHGRSRLIGGTPPAGSCQLDISNQPGTTQGEKGKKQEWKAPSKERRDGVSRRDTVVKDEGNWQGKEKKGLVYREAGFRHVPEVIDADVLNEEYTHRIDAEESLVQDVVNLLSGCRFHLLGNGMDWNAGKFRIALDRGF